MRTTLRSGRRFDQVIMELAARQHGVVTRAQLVSVGITTDVLDRRVKSGLLRRVHQGVYQVGPIVAPLARELAAALACGPTGLVSHRSAVFVWELCAGTRRPASPHVIGRDGHHRVPGVVVHRIRTVAREDATRLHGVPITTPTRTLYDLATLTGGRELEQAVAEALAKRRTTRARLAALLARHSGRPGARRLRVLLDAGQPLMTRSEAEERFLTLVDAAGLPRPEANVTVAGYLVDFVWRSQHLVVEIDGFAFHSRHRSFEADRRRDRDLTSRGVRVIRVTWWQIEDEPFVVIACITRALALAESPTVRQVAVDARDGAAGHAPHAASGAPVSD